MDEVIDFSIADAGQPRSQASAAYVRLKSEVLGGLRAPGEKLKINDIAQALDVSPGAVREALSRLAPEGLVLFRDQKGFVVAPLSIEDLDDLTQMRCDLEELALRRSVANGDADWEALVLATAHRLRRTPKVGSQERADGGWLVQHEKFHSALVSACGSPRLLAIRAGLHQQSERYRVLSTFVDAGRDVDAEHQALADAALDRNADELVRRAKAHFQETTALIKAAFSASPAHRLDAATSA